MLTPDQIFLLEAQGNRSSNWGGVKLLCPAGVSFDSSLDKIRGCYFNGNIFIGLFVKTTMMSGGISVVSGLYNSNFSGNCILSDNCYVWNTAMLMNVYVGRNSCVVGCGSVVGEGHTSFGTSRTIKIGCEGPGTSSGTGAGVHREVILSVRSSYADMCGSVFLRQDRSGANDDAMDGGKGMDEGFGGMMPVGASSSSQHAAIPIGGGMGVMGGMMGQQHSAANKPKRAKYNRNDGHVRFDMTIVCDDVELVGCTTVRNSFIGSYSNVRDSSVTSSTALAHCEVSSANLVDVVMHQSCKVLSGAQLNGVLLFPHSSVTSQAKVSEAILGPDCSVSIGECHHSLLGPHSGFHHQALLIASSWPMGRGNIAYGAMIGKAEQIEPRIASCLFSPLTALFPLCRCQPHESQQRPGELPGRGQLLRPGLLGHLPFQRAQLALLDRGLEHRPAAAEDRLPVQPAV
jgi:carbonic anhydrase/acetyltransferase-like protein (isoleucine patch superfamily)